MRLVPRLALRRPAPRSAAASVPGQRAAGGWTAALLLGPLLAVLLAAWLHGVRPSQLRTPLYYSGDALSMLMFTHTLTERPWWLTTDRLGAPFQMDLHDYPFNPSLHFGLMKLMTLGTRDPFLLSNLYFLFGIGLTAGSGLVVLRALGLRPLPSVATATLFALSPYVLWRGTSHVYLAVCYMIPLTVLVAVWLARGERLFDRLWGKGAVAVAICVANGFDFPYYTFFACFFLLAAGLRGALARAEWRPLVRAGVLTGVTVAAFAGNLWPNLMYAREHGPNRSPDAVRKQWVESEVYGLKLTSLLMPAFGHRVEALRQMQLEYHEGTIAKGERSGSLGAVGALAFLGLLAVLLSGRRPSGSDLPGHLAALVLAAIALASVGGLGTLTNFLTMTSSVRCYERVSIYVLFCALTFAALLGGTLTSRAAGGGAGRRWGGPAAVLAVLAFGVWDVGLPKNLEPFDVVRAKFESDRDFVRQIEGQLPVGAAVFNLPHATFLSSVGQRIADGPYSHFRYYVHSRSVRWSYGATCGRTPALLLERLVAQPTPALVDALCAIGFAGVTVDRQMLRPEEAGLLEELVALLGEPTAGSPDGRHLFFPTTLRRALLEARHSPEQLADLRRQALGPVVMQWGGKFYHEEGHPGALWRWCDREGTLQLVNLGDVTRLVRFRFQAHPIRPDAASLVVDSPQLGTLLEVQINWALAWHELDVTLPPKGAVDLRFRSDAAREFPARALSFAVRNYTLAEK